MTESPLAAVERAWREGQAGIDDGSPEALRAAAAQLEGLAENPEVSALARAHILYDAGVARLLGIDADAPVPALSCETRASQGIELTRKLGRSLGIVFWKRTS